MTYRVTILKARKKKRGGLSLNCAVCGSPAMFVGEGAAQGVVCSKDRRHGRRRNVKHM
jgi:hypothetical protein